MATIVDGNAIFDEIREAVAVSFSDLKTRTRIVPRIAILQVGAAEAAALYTRRLQRTLANVGIEVELQELPGGLSLDEACAALSNLSDNPAIHAIQVQTPLPPQIPLAQLVQVLSPEKDLDGLHPRNLGLLAQGQPDIVPATPQAGLEILQRYQVALAGTRAVVVGRSLLVGRPMALLLVHKDATVTICHTRTRELGAIACEAEILVVAAGKPGLIRADMVRPGAAVIDFGVNLVNGQLVGDVEPAAAERAGLFTPVPGGTGPVTNAMLLRNALMLYQRAVGAAA